MKIVQLETQDERSLSAKQVFARQADVTLIQTASLDRFLLAAANGDVDLFLCSSSDLRREGQDPLRTLRHRHPGVPTIFFVSEEEKGEAFLDPNLDAWDVISPSEAARLPFSAIRAVQSRRTEENLKAELLRARDLLVSCQKNISIGRLLGSIAHEINNPLEAISNLLYLGQRSLSDEEEVRRCLQMAEEELQRVGEITKQMLHFHRDSKAPQEVSLPEVIESVLVLYQNRLDMQNIQVSKQYHSQSRLVAHPGELRQAFSNFIANAIDAMPHGGKLNVRIRDEKRCRLSVTIADSGHGISSEQVHRLGELLFTTKGEAGTGLGLWVTFQILAKYGGAVQVHSSTRPGKSGTVFKLCFADPRLVVQVSGRDDGTQMMVREDRTRKGRSAKIEVNLEKREGIG